MAIGLACAQGRRLSAPRPRGLGGRRRNRKDTAGGRRPHLTVHGKGHFLKGIVVKTSQNTSVHGIATFLGTQITAPTPNRSKNASTNTSTSNPRSVSSQKSEWPQRRLTALAHTMEGHILQASDKALDRREKEETRGALGRNLLVQWTQHS